jgi:hypothetical protein
MDYPGYNEFKNIEYRYNYTSSFERGEVKSLVVDIQPPTAYSNHTKPQPS